MKQTCAVRTESVGYHIGGIKIVEGVSLEIEQGEFIVVIGPNGAGKTTLVNLLSGVAYPTAGRILLFDRDVTRAAPYERARLGLGRTFQTSSVFNALSALENVRLAAQAYLGGSYALWRLADAGQNALERARDALEHVGLAHRMHDAAASLSHGEKRKLDLAILLCLEPRVAVLDEPTAGMAVEDVPEILELVSRMHRERGCTVIMVEHRLDLVSQLAGRMAVMHHGSLLAIDTPERVIANETVQTAYLGDPL
ncbi:MAG TPA: ABC transporter ATP-binding protein [Candidatus Acidoferrales bacterium]|nr:ABC transporter ATP-binding protein [Candidatus Acidoferrales bacterium]